MTLGPLVLLLSICLVAFQFWRLRGIAEYSIDYCKQYCDKNHLQFIALARLNTRPSFSSGRFDWKIEYALEFSSNGEDAYVGTVTCVGKQILTVDLPAYKIN